MTGGSRLLLAMSLVVFVVLATANGGGYRYGVSDQAFYIPAIAHAADPALFPRDGDLIGAQSRLMVLDEAFAGVLRATHVPLPVLFAAGYFVSLALVWSALVLIGETLYLHAWTRVALLAAVTLRHQITRTSANSLEPYFHPRMLAFGVCAIAVAAVLRRRGGTAIALVAVGGAIHPTTALWFAVLVGVALIVSRPELRVPLAAAALLLLMVVTFAGTTGRLDPLLVRIDPAWREVIGVKTTLFAHEWPITAWVANLGTALLLAWACVDRRRHGLASAEDAGLAAGAAVLLGVFLMTLPLVADGVFLAVELQISRVFWPIDLLATIYLLAAIDRRAAGARLGRAVAVGLLVFSVSRGTFALWVEHPERRLFAFSLEESAWHDAMRWIAKQPADVHVLADPGHAWRYGTSVRVSAGRDVFQEDVKDSAMAIYSREVAMRVRERARALGDFAKLTAPRAKELARQYDLDYLVTSAAIPLPAAYRNREFTIYRFE